jgi:hypothetical protein
MYYLRIFLYLIFSGAHCSVMISYKLATMLISVQSLFETSRARVTLIATSQGHGIFGNDVETYGLADH